MKLINILPIMTFFVSCLVYANGENGKIGVLGQSGSNGRNGSISINFVPTSATAQFPYYMPIVNCDTKGVQSILNSGLNINLPMKTSSKITAFQLAVFNQCSEVIEMMVANSDPQNKPNLDLPMYDQEGNLINLYQTLLIAEGTTLPNAAVRTTSLEIFKDLISLETNSDQLLKKMSSILQLLTAKENGYATFSNNLKVVELVENRINEINSAH